MVHIEDVKEAIKQVFGGTHFDVKSKKETRFGREYQTELIYQRGVMYEISDNNDFLCWSVKKINDESLDGFIELIKNRKDEYYSLEMITRFKKGLK